MIHLGTSQHESFKTRKREQSQPDSEIIETKQVPNDEFPSTLTCPHGHEGLLMSYMHSGKVMRQIRQLKLILILRLRQLRIVAKLRVEALQARLSYFGKTLQVFIPRQIKKLHKQDLLFTCSYFHILLKILDIFIILI